MKKEVNGSETIYLIALFCMPIITFFGVTLLLDYMTNISSSVTVTKYDINGAFSREIVLYMVCWILLFASYLFHKLGSKVGQLVDMALCFFILIYAVVIAVTSATSIANLMNPIIVGSASLFGLMNPLPKETVEKRRTRVKNSIEKYKPKKSTSKKKVESNKK